MILLKAKPTIIILIITGIGILSFFLLIQDPLCGIRHLLLTSDLQSYEKSFDEEFCESLVLRIDSFNENCEPAIEILDCG